MSILDRLLESLRGRDTAGRIGLGELSRERLSEAVDGPGQDMGPSALIVGLGNPGLEYSATRHNMGFLCLDRLATKHRLRFTGKRAKSVVARGSINGQDVALAKPQTFMNLSGESVKELLRIYGVPTRALLVVYDDIDLPPGTVRIRERGGPGTHNGMRSIVDEIGSTEFPRLRIGVGMPTDGQNLADYVLGLPSAEERDVLDPALDRSVEAIETVVRRGIGAAMNQFNR